MKYIFQEKANTVEELIYQFKTKPSIRLIDDLEQIIGENETFDADIEIKENKLIIKINALTSDYDDEELNHLIRFIHKVVGKNHNFELIQEKADFEDKVKAISKSLRAKDHRLSKANADNQAKRIAGSIIKKKHMEKMKQNIFLKVKGPIKNPNDFEDNLELYIDTRQSTEIPEELFDISVVDFRPNEVVLEVVLEADEKTPLTKFEAFVKKAIKSFCPNAKISYTFNNKF